MKWLRLALIAILVLGSASPDVASADRGRFHRHSRSSFSVFVDVPLFWGWPRPYYSPFYAPYPYYYPPYYAYPPVVTVPSSPPVYIERDDEAYADRSSAGSYWYYCDRPGGYYPDVKECPGGWERVKPRSSR